MADEKDTYSVEVRTTEDDYSEEHFDFDTAEEVRAFIKDLDEDEHVHSVLFYPAGTNCDPKDVTRRF